MNNYVRGMLAGFFATIALSILMILKGMMGLMPHLNVIHMLARMAHGYMGIAATPALGWLLHFLIGSIVWGLAFAFLFSRLPGAGAVVKGLIFGILAWLLMMILPMPMAGAGFFGLKMGLMAPLMTLILHLAYGAVLGYVYGFLNKNPSTAAV